MAIVKICPTCESSNSPTSPFCSGCGVSLVNVAPSNPPNVLTSQDRGRADNVATVVCPDCGAENPGRYVRCVYCDFSLAFQGSRTQLVKFELTWPWGKQELTVPLRIGRNSPAPAGLIKEIGDLGHDNISGSHADLLPDVSTGFVSLVDLGSKNGTFVDGVRIPANKPVCLRSGAVVRFAANLSVTVTVVQPSPDDSSS